MEKIDLRKELKKYYRPSAKKVELIEVPRFKFLMIDGVIEPHTGPSDSQSFQEATEAIYGAAYTLKFMSKLREVNPIDYNMMTLEGLWEITEGEFNIERKDNWAFTLLFLQPEHITQEMFAEALQQMRRKKGDKPGFARLRLEDFAEGLCVQTMHIGPYATEPATVARMEEFAAENGYTMQHRHHEIYLGDPRRSQPEKLKTVLRHPVIKQS